MEMGGLPDTEWLYSDHTPSSDVQPVGLCASEPCDGCACLYFRLDAEGTFSYTEQTTETTTCPPTIFLRVKNPRFFDSHCIIGRVSAVPEDTTAGNSWNCLTLQEKGLGTICGLGWIWFFSFSRMLGIV